MTATHAYIGIRPSDGSVRAICTDDADFANDTARTVAQWIKIGRVVQRVPIDEANRLFSESGKSDGNLSDTTSPKQSGGQG